MAGSVRKGGSAQNKELGVDDVLVAKAGTDEQPRLEQGSSQTNSTELGPLQSADTHPQVRPPHGIPEDGGSSLSLAPTPSRVGFLSLSGCQRDRRLQLSLADTT